MVQKQVLATFPCRVRRRARIVTGAILGDRHRDQRTRGHGPNLSPVSNQRCSTRPPDSIFLGL
jgi:hypothetical protein